MIDLHTHILYAVDDGAADLDEAVAMVRRSVEDGITALVATPHVRHPTFWNGDADRLRARFDAVVDAVAEAALEVELHVGGEIAVSSASLDEIQQLPGGTLPTLGTSRWLLLELDWHGIGPDPEELVHEVQVVGHRPLIAHPERVRWLTAEPRRLAALATAGARFQVTAQSVTGALGPEAESAALDLIDRGLVHCVASDMHDVDLRPPGLSKARAMVAEHWGDDAATALFVDNPRRILADAEPSALTTGEPGQGRRSGWLGRLFGGLR